MIRRVMGLDPGVKGGMGIIKSHDDYECFGFLKLTNLERSELIKEKMSEVDFAYVEWVHGVGGWSANASFMLGKSLGHLETTLNIYGIPNDKVTARVWQTKLKCLSGGDKAITRAKAQALFPLIDKITNQTADALLIAKYGFDKENG